MDDDLKQVAVWAKQSNLTWLDLVQAIIQVLRKHWVLHSPMTFFSKLSPSLGEPDLVFTLKIRDAYFMLPIQNRASLAIKEAFNDKLQELLPSILLNIRDKIDILSTVAAIVESIQISRLLKRNLDPPSRITEIKLTTAAIEDPRLDDRITNATTETEDDQINYVLEDRNTS
ncbi:hypothetical protein K3495_g6990 [Podosphaera aphanis]|nr:hypothetical protein K3495_g6990 [Podosphaera aphanis]